MAFRPDICMTPGPQLRIMHDIQNTIPTNYNNSIISMMHLFTFNSHDPNRALRSHLETSSNGQSV